MITLAYGTAPVLNCSIAIARLSEAAFSASACALSVAASYWMARSESATF